MRSGTLTGAAKAALAAVASVVLTIVLRRLLEHVAAIRELVTETYHDVKAIRAHRDYDATTLARRLEGVLARVTGLGTELHDVVEKLAGGGRAPRTGDLQRASAVDTVRTGSDRR